ncbi:MAG: hypothetical protein ABSC25_06490 [Roseiarcus sp.]
MSAFAPANLHPTFRRRLADLLRALADWLSAPRRSQRRAPLEKPFPFLGD